MNPGRVEVAQPVLRTPKELASRWCCSVGHLANLRSAGAGPNYTKISGIRYGVVDVVAYEDSRAVSLVLGRVQGAASVCRSREPRGRRDNART